MTPETMLDTEAMIERIVTAAGPEIKTAMRALLLGGHGIHAFEIALGTNSGTGLQSKITCFVAHEAPAAILEGAGQGFAKAQEIAFRQIAAQQHGPIS